MTWLAACLSLALGSTAAAHPSASLSALEHHLLERRARASSPLRQQLWATPLGQLVGEYLSDDVPPEEVTRRAHRIARRVYSSMPLQLPRMLALRLMYTDVHERGIVDLRTLSRIHQLEVETDLREHVALKQAAEQMKEIFPYFAALGFVAGSKFVRGQVKSAVEIAKIKTHLERAPFPEARLEIFDKDFKKVVRNRFFEEYSLWKAGKVTLGTWGSTAALYLIFADGNDDGATPFEEIWQILVESGTSLEKL